MCRACATGELYTQLTQALKLSSATGPIFLRGKLMLRDVWWVDTSEEGCEHWTGDRFGAHTAPATYVGQVTAAV